MQSSFQTGVDSIYNKCVSCGSTPSSKSPSACVTSIGNIYTNRYNSGYNSGYSDGSSVSKAAPITLPRIYGSVYSSGNATARFDIDVSSYSSFYAEKFTRNENNPTLKLLSLDSSLNTLSTLKSLSATTSSVSVSLSSVSILRIEMGLTQPSSGGWVRGTLTNVTIS